MMNQPALMKLINLISYFLHRAMMMMMTEADTVPMIKHFLNKTETYNPFYYFCIVLKYFFTCLAYIYSTYSIISFISKNFLKIVFALTLSHCFVNLPKYFFKLFFNFYRYSLFYSMIYLHVKNTNVYTNACIASRNFICYNGFTR